MSVETRIDPADWPAAVADTDGPQLIVAGPGTGKTEFLVRRAVHLVAETSVAPDRLLLLSFSRRSASDLRRRVEAGLDRSTTTITASTFHSLAYLLLEAYGVDTFGWDDMPTLLTSPEQVAIVHELLAEEDTARWPVPYRDLLTTSTFAAEVADFILRCQEQLIDPEHLAERAAERRDWRGLPGFLTRYLETLADRGRLDYGSLQARAVQLLGVSDVLDAVGDRFRYILVDEYQDTTVAQAEFLRALYLPHRNLTVAGDPYQSIYSFRGTELHNIEDFPARFPDAQDRPARRLVLTTSFRVPSEILEAAVRVTSHKELPGGAGPVIPAQGKGSVATHGFDQQTDEAEWIASEVQRTHLTESIPYRRIGVLVRSKRRFLPELSRALERRGIPHDRPDVRLADHPAVRLVLDCVTAAVGEGTEATGAVERILLGPIFSITLGRLRELQRFRAAAPEVGWHELIRRELPDAAALADLLADPAWAATDPAPVGFWKWWSTLPGLPAVVTDPARSDERAAWSSLSQVLDRLHERDPGASLLDYLRLTTDEEFEAEPLLRFRASDEDRLTLTTLHQAKGLEFDVVFIADATEGVFPDLRPRESLLGSRHLSRTQPSDPAEYARFRLQEETRLAYTAMGRARRRVVWTTTSSGSDEGRQAPSRFLALVAGVATIAEATVPPRRDRGDPVTPLEAEAHLRRLVRDPSRPEPLRLAALRSLGHGERWGLRPVAAFAGIRERGLDHGLIPEGFRLSPSQIQAYSTCPRRYAFERRLRVGAEGSIYAEFGTMIHDILERAERAALDRNEDHSTVEQALAFLDELWDGSVFGGGPWAEAWRNRAEQTLHHLYHYWPSPGVAVSLEHELKLELDGVEWQGRADRIEAHEGRVTIVDYKTTRSPVTQDEAAMSPQLGFYYLAAAADPAITAHGEMAGAEFWYPAKTDRKSVARRTLDPSLLDEVRDVLVDGTRGIRAEDWSPGLGPHCEKQCRVRMVCPAWPEGREAFQG